MQNLQLKVRVRLFLPRPLALPVVLAKYQLLLCESVEVLHRRAVLYVRAVSPKTTFLMDRLNPGKPPQAHIATTVNECERSTFFVHDES